MVALPRGGDQGFHGPRQWAAQGQNPPPLQLIGLKRLVDGALGVARIFLIRPGAAPRRGAPPGATHERRERVDSRNSLKIAGSEQPPRLLTAGRRATPTHCMLWRRYAASCLPCPPPGNLKRGISAMRVQASGDHSPRYRDQGFGIERSPPFLIPYFALLADAMPDEG